MPLCLLLLTSSLIADADALKNQGIQLCGQYEENFILGNFVLGGTPIRCFAFTYSGPLESRLVQRKVNLFSTI